MTFDTEYERLVGTQDPYAVLGVAPRAPLEVIKAAHRTLMRRYHPDLYVGPAEQAHRASAAINTAWATVEDPFMRARADRVYHVVERECPRCKGRGEVAQQRGFKVKTYVVCPVCKGLGVKNTQPK